MAKKKDITGVRTIVATESQISKICDKAKEDIFAKVAKHVAKHPNDALAGKRLVELEQNVKAMYSELGIYIDDEFRKSMPKVMQEYYAKAAKKMEKTGETALGAPNSALVKQQLENTFQQVAMKTTQMTFEHVKQLRKISAEIFRTAALTGASRAEVTKQLLDRIADVQGFQFVAANGRVWKNEVYFRMLARTELMNAGRLAFDEKCANDGYDIVRLDYGGEGCEACGKWEGQIFSLTGATKGLPTKDELIADGVFHPNCVHSYSVVTDYELEEMGLDIRQPGNSSGDNAAKEEPKTVEKRIEDDRKAEEEARRKAEEEARKKAEEEHKAHRKEQLWRAKENREKRIVETKKQFDDEEKKLETAIIKHGANSDKTKEIVENLNALYKKIEHYEGKKQIGINADDYVKKKAEKIEKNLEKKAEKIGKSIEKLNSQYADKYDGIWKHNDPTPADYPSLKESVQKKYEYYENNPGHEDKIAKLDEFVEKGKKYEEEFEKLNSKYEAANKKLDEFYSKNPKPEGKTYSDENKAKALSFARNEIAKADKYWDGYNAIDRSAPIEEHEAAYDYTTGSGRFNRPLNGFNGTWNNYVGPGKVDLDNEGNKRNIELLTKYINRFDIKNDVILYHGENGKTLNNELKLKKSIVNFSDSELKELAGKKLTIHGFFSTAVNTDAGFANEKIYWKIFAPKGTKGAWVEPFSAYKGYGEREVILQRGYTYRITDAKRDKKGRIIVDAEVRTDIPNVFLK